MKASNRFLIDSDDCELLVEFEECPSLAELSLKIGRDHSVVARSLKRIADRFPVLEKRAGRWSLTELGRKLNEQTRAALSAQRSVLQSQRVLRLGANREFAARVIAAEFASMQQMFPQTLLSIASYERGIEPALLQGHIDIGLDCERPQHPEIAYRLIQDEPIVAVASARFAQAHRHRIANEGYLRLPHLLCERLHPDRFLSNAESDWSIIARFNDIAAVREACMQSIGWALLPTYSIKPELESGLLVRLDPTECVQLQYGVWWPRSRPALKEEAQKLAKWLQEKSLS